MLRKFRKAAALPLAEWLILGEAWIKLLLVDLLLRTRPFPTLQRLVAGRMRPRQSPIQPQALETINRIRILVAAAGNHHLYPMTCLRQSLALQEMLGRRAIPTELHLGVRKEAGVLLAHAWLEYQGLPVESGSPVNDRFTPFFPMDSIQ